MRREQRVTVALLVAAVFVLTTPKIDVLTEFAASAYGNAAPPYAPTKATIRKSSVIVSAQTHPEYYPDPNAQYDDLTWSWTPYIRLAVNGPVEPGSVINVEYTKPDGKAWLNYDCDTKETPEGSLYKGECGRNLPSKQGLIQTGMFGFKITLRNELQGLSAPLFAGKFKVDKFIFNPANNPKYNKNFVYWVNEDWRLPIGYVFAAEPVDYATGSTDNVDFAPLIVQMWFRGNSETTYHADAHLFYQGKEVASTTQPPGTAWEPEVAMTTLAENTDTQYHLKSFQLGALVFDKKTVPGFTAAGFPMYDHPGEYEVKVLENGHLARIAKFMMGTDGHIVNNGIGDANQVGTTRVLIPVQVVGDQDGPWDKNSWRTQAFYGNPLNGFAVQ